VPRKRSYTVELESARIGQAVTDELLDTFAGALFADKRIAGPAPTADAGRQTLELRTCVDATGPANAVAVAEVAFVRAARKAGVVVDVTVANVWLDAAAIGDSAENVQRRTNV
jgi:hypothetical protein